MKLIFFGTPDYVLPVLDALHKKLKTKHGDSPITAVVTQPPKPAGRKKEIQFSAIDTWAHKRGIQKYYDPDDLIKDKIDTDLGILASYGTIISKDVIRSFRHGILNIHPSLLPQWRGASPVQATIISGSQAGSTIIKIDDKLDHGPIISQFKDEVLPNDTTETLRNRLFEKSAEVLTTLIPAYISGKITPREQNDSEATLTCEIKKSDGFIPPKYINATLQGRTLKGKWKIGFMKDYTNHPTPSTIHNFIRAMQPWPQAWTYVQLEQSAKCKVQKSLKILKAHIEPVADPVVNHKLPAIKSKRTNHESRITNHHLVLDEVQLEGKNPVSWQQFIEGYEFSFN